MLPKDVIIETGSLFASEVEDPRSSDFATACCGCTVICPRATWLVSAWDLLCQAALYARYHLLPAPTNNYQRCKSTELRYDTAFTIQTRIISLLTLRGQRSFKFRVAHHWTLRSGSHFMPSAAAARARSRSDRDLLGGWGAEGAKDTAGVAKNRTAWVQREVAATFQLTKEGFATTAGA